MSRTIVASCAALALALAGPGAAGAAGIRGDYIEARTADVYTGPCFSNAEVFVYGDHAVMAWKVTEGSYRGVDLAGLGVAAAVEGTTTFSEDRPGDARSVLIVDDRADSRQRDALVAMARELAGRRLDRVVAVKSARISLKVEAHGASMSGGDGAERAHASHGMPHAPAATFWAPGLASIVTRPLDETRDHACGNEVITYGPLSSGVSVLPAYTLGHQFKSRDLGTTWDDPNCRSSFVGHFALGL
jgi:Protein of unknown function (DUF1326)